MGLIDFNRLEFGDPLFDLAKIGFFTTEVSIPFARGNILGYIDKEEVTDFGIFTRFTRRCILLRLLIGQQKMNLVILKS